MPGTRKTRAELETAFGINGTRAITAQKMLDLLASLPLVDEVGGVVMGPELVTGDDQNALGGTVGNWTAPNGGTLNDANDGNKKLPFSESDNYIQFFAAGSDDLISLTMTGVTLESGKRYAVLVVVENDIPDAVDITVTLNGAAAGRYVGTDRYQLVWEFVPVQGFYSPGTNVSDPVLTIKQDFAKEDRLAVYYVSVREVKVVKPMMGPLWVPNDSNVILIVQGQKWGDSDHNFQEGVFNFAGSNATGNPVGSLYTAGEWDHAGSLYLDRGWRGESQKQRFYKSSDQEVTNTTLAVVSSLGINLNKDDTQYMTNGGLMRFRYELWVLIDSASVGFKLGWILAGTPPTFNVFKWTVQILDSTMARVEGAFFTAHTDTLNSSLGAGTYRVIVEGVFNLNVFAHNDDVQLAFAQNATGDSAGVHVQPGSIVFVDGIN